MLYRIVFFEYSHSKVALILSVLLIPMPGSNTLGETALCPPEPSTMPLVGIQPDRIVFVDDEDDEITGACHISVSCVIQGG